MLTSLIRKLLSGSASRKTPLTRMGRTSTILSRRAQAEWTTPIACTLGPMAMST
jgi:hypothetical protein